MRDNPAIRLYRAIDLDQIKQPKQNVETKGLLAPKKRMQKDNVDSSQPFIRVIKHMQAINKKRNEING